MLLSDAEIRERNFIHPFSEPVSGNGIISYGLTSYGYDARLGNNFKVFKGECNDVYGKIIDPKRFDPIIVKEVNNVPDGEAVIIPPNGFILGETKEWFDIPRDVLALCVGKSTLCRCGILVNVSPLEAEWKGKVTMEISNLTPLPVKVYAGEGITQFIFMKGNRVCERSYADKKGKYQFQSGIELPKVL